VTAKKLTKAERIAARQARVAAKRNKEDAKFKQEDDDDQAAKVSMSKAKITDARNTVDGTQSTAMENVTDIRVNRDHRENTRRRKEEDKRAERLRELEKELLESTSINREIELKWAEIAQKDIPQELYTQIAIQYKAASKLLGSKDEIIKQLQTELKVKDEDYVELLAQHHDDVENLVKQIKQQFATLQSVCGHELKEVERVATQERGELITTNREEVEGLFKKRREMELQTMYEKQRREEEFQRELTKIRGTDAEDYNNLKVTLENNIQLLEQQLEEMRATYQLNTEKLEYNHAVLEERDSENKQTVEHHRQRLRRLKEALSNHKQRFFKQDAKFKNENNELTEDYQRITEQFKDLQKKFRHFEMVDTKKFREVWAMNEDNVMTLVRKVLKADSIIHEQILGLNYVSAYKAGDGQAVEVEKVTSAQIFNAVHPRDEEQSLTAQMGLGSPAADSSAAQQQMGRFTRAQIRLVMGMLASEASFLVDSRLKETLRGMSEEEGDIYRVDAVLSSLGVEDREDLDELVGFFYEDPKAEKPSIHPNDIIKVVRDFVVQRQQSKSKAGEGGVSTGVKTDSVSNEKKARKREREKRFWQKLGSVVSDHTASVWDALEKAQRKYNQLLEDRAQAIDDTTELAKQNEELKILLQEYLGSKINQDLQIPPTRLITVNNET